MSSVERTTSLCEAMIKAKLNIKFWCNGRLNYAKLEVLRLMKAAGCVLVKFAIRLLSCLSFAVVQQQH
jgi:hypothetical protein